MDELVHHFLNHLRLRIWWGFKGLYLSFSWLNDSWTRRFEIVTHKFKFVTSELELVTSKFELATLEFDLVSSNTHYCISTCGFKLSTYC